VDQTSIEIKEITEAFKSIGDLIYLAKQNFNSGQLGETLSTYF
jgi:hypothetical protein